MKKKIISMLLAVSLLVTMAIPSVFAAVAGDNVTMSGATLDNAAAVADSVRATLGNNYNTFAATGTITMNSDNAYNYTTNQGYGYPVQAFRLYLNYSCGGRTGSGIVLTSTPAQITMNVPIVGHSYTMLYYENGSYYNTVGSTSTATITFSANKLDGAGVYVLCDNNYYNNGQNGYGQYWVPEWKDANGTIHPGYWTGSNGYMDSNGVWHAGDYVNNSNNSNRYWHDGYWDAAGKWHDGYWDNNSNTNTTTSSSESIAYYNRIEGQINAAPRSSTVKIPVNYDQIPGSLLKAGNANNCTLLLEKASKTVTITPSTIDYNLDSYSFDTLEFLFKDVQTAPVPPTPEVVPPATVAPTPTPTPTPQPTNPPATANPQTGDSWFAGLFN